MDSVLQALVTVALLYLVDHRPSGIRVGITVSNAHAGCVDAAASSCIDILTLTLLQTLLQAVVIACGHAQLVWGLIMGCTVGHRHGVATGGSVKG